MSLRWTAAQKLERRWWRRYLRDRPVDDYLAWKRSYWTDLLEPLRGPLGLESARRILDAGCGPGGVFLVLRGHDVTAVDPLLDAYARDLVHFDPRATPWVDFRSGRLEDFAAGEPFEIAFCMNAINHVEDLDRAFGRLAGAVQPGGRLVLSVDAHRWRPAKHLFRAVPGDALHPHQHDASDYRRMIADRGGKIETERIVKRGGFFDHVLFVARIQK